MRVPLASALLSDLRAMENKEIRRANMLLLAEQLGSLEALAEKTKTAAKYLSQVKNRWNGRGMGDDVARRIEAHMRKPRGWMDVSHASSEIAHHSVSDGPDVRMQVPLISWVEAGKFNEANDVYRVGDAEDWYPMPKKAGHNTYCLRVEGDSMTAPHGKSYPAGSIIFVDPDQRSPASGQRVIAKLEGSDTVTFKVFVQEAGRTFLRPLNPQYPPIHDPFKIIGTVVGKWEDD